MVNRTNRNAAREINKLNDKAVSDNASDARPSQRSAKDKYTNDELIVSLSDSYENKRARQVFEWECIQPKVMQRAA